ncbi:hypothetical protein HMPREF0971_00609 [Segatella oris F0302]|uniref:Uncharacterized protein n=1 Tax=Segatella oris F0302 TaxID=649760 RepID=D1QNV8_9BACT|nr:hypothetical protein HMPREF0971_00609 [Segatella oris F0302]
MKRNYNCLHKTCKFKTVVFLAPNKCCFLAFCNLLNIKLL